MKYWSKQPVVTCCNSNSAVGSTNMFSWFKLWNVIQIPPMNHKTLSKFNPPQHPETCLKHLFTQQIIKTSPETVAVPALPSGILTYRKCHMYSSLIWVWKNGDFLAANCKRKKQYPYPLICLGAPPRSTQNAAFGMRVRHACSARGPARKHVYDNLRWATYIVCM